MSTNREQLIEEWKIAAGQVSFHNAAEGDSWYREAEARSKSYSRLRRAEEALAAIGEEATVAELRKSGGYLL